MSGPPPQQTLQPEGPRPGPSPTRGRGRGGTAGRGRGAASPPQGTSPAPRPPPPGAPGGAGGSKSPMGRGRGGLPPRGRGGPPPMGAAAPPPAAATSPSPANDGEGADGHAIQAEGSAGNPAMQTPQNMSRRVSLTPSATGGGGAEAPGSRSGSVPTAPDQGVPGKKSPMPPVGGKSSPAPSAGKKSPNPMLGKKSPMPLGGKKSPALPVAGKKMLGPAPTGKPPTPTTVNAAAAAAISAPAVASDKKDGEGGGEGEGGNGANSTTDALSSTPPRTPPSHALSMPDPPEPPSMGGGASSGQQRPKGFAEPEDRVGSCRVIVAIDPEVTAGVDWRQNKVIVTVDMNKPIGSILQAVQSRYRIDDVLEVTVPVSARGKDYNTIQPVMDDVIQLALTPLQIGWRPDSYNWVWFRTKVIPRDDNDPAMRQLTTREWYLERVKRFYEFYDRSRVNTCEALLDDFDGSEDLLMVRLIGKYGREPTREMLRQNRIARNIREMDATPQSIMADRVSGREEERERDAKERHSQALALQAAEAAKAERAAGGGRNNRRGGNNRGPPGSRMAMADPELRKNLEILFARNDNEKSLRIIYFRKWIQFLSVKRVRSKMTELLQSSASTALYRAYYEKFKTFRIVSTMTKQLKESNVAANKAESLVSELQSESSHLKGEVKKLQTQVELLDSTNARRLETLCNSSELAINQIKALTQECQAKEATILRLEQKLMGVGNMALAAGEKKDFALKTAVTARMEMEERLKATTDRANEIETAYSQAQNEIRRLKKKSEMRKKLLTTTATSSLGPDGLKIQRSTSAGDAISSTDDEDEEKADHGKHDSATIAAVQKECRHCIHYSQQKFVIDAHQRAADESRNKIDELERALQKVQSLLNTCEDENMALRRELAKKGGGGGGGAPTASPATPTSTVQSPNSASQQHHQHQQHRTLSPSSSGPTAASHHQHHQHQHQSFPYSPNSDPQSLSGTTNQLVGIGGPSSGVGGLSASINGGGNGGDGSGGANNGDGLGGAVPVPASIQALLGGGAAGGANANRALAAGLGLNLPGVATAASGATPSAAAVVAGMVPPGNLQSSAMMNGGTNANNNGHTSTALDEAAVNAAVLGSGTTALLEPFKTYDGSTNPTWGFGRTTATPSTLVRNDKLPNNYSAAPRYAEYMLSAQQAQLNAQQAQLDNEARNMMGARGQPITDERERALAVGPRIGRSDLAGGDLSLKNYFAVDAAVGQEKMMLQMDRQLHQSRVGLLPHERDRLVKAREAERRALLSNSMHNMGGAFAADFMQISSSANNSNAIGGGGNNANGGGPNAATPTEGGGGGGARPHVNSGHYTVKVANEGLSNANKQGGIMGTAKRYDAMGGILGTGGSGSRPLATVATNPMASFTAYEDKLRKGNQVYTIPGIGDINGMGMGASNTRASNSTHNTARGGVGGGETAHQPATSAAMGLILGMGGANHHHGAPSSAGAGAGAMSTDLLMGMGLAMGEGLGTSTAMTMPGERPRQGTGDRYKYSTIPLPNGSIKPMRDVIFNSVLPPK